MSTQLDSSPIPRPSPQGQPVRLFSHRPLVSWGPEWLVGFLLPARTWADGRLLALLAAVFCLTAGPALGQPVKGSPEDQTAIGKQAEKFIDAFHKGDAKALAAFWAPDGDYTDLTGHTMKGRDAIQKLFEEFFTETKGLKLRIESQSLRFVTPDVAVEDGETSGISPEGTPPSRARFTIVHVKRDGQWLLSSVRDAPFAPPSNYENLRGLEWIVGDWAAEDEKGIGEQLSVSWADNQNWLTGTFSTTARGVSVGRATHWVGWDPAAKKVRSWIFDATGGFGEGAWTKDGDKWVIKTTSVLQDGKKATATILLARVDADTLSLQSKDKTVDGKAVPDTAVVKLKRVK